MSPVPAHNAADYQRKRRAAARIAAYDPTITCDGLTIETPDGPVDLVAIERARAGHPVTLTRAEREHLFDALPTETAVVEPIAEALGIDPVAVQRGIYRHRARTLVSA